MEQWLVSCSWARRPLSLLLLRLYFIILAAIVVLFGLEMFSFALRTHSSIFLNTRFPSLMASTAISLLWFAYFRKSARVKNTYGSNL
jgi:hypothetical protein